MSTPSIPGPKAPPKKMQEEAKAERARRKACHGNWYPCTPDCGATQSTFSESYAQSHGFLSQADMRGEY